MDTLTQLRAGKLTGSTRLDLGAGLTEFPREIFELAESLEILNLTGNRLRKLPKDLARLKRLRILFCSENEFTELPAVLGECPRLEMVGFKANAIEKVEGAALPERLRWLILTDNRLQKLPAELGRCRRLQKLMLSGNRLTSLPETMADCGNLELLRLAANELEVLPPWLLALPRLSWLAFAGNPCSRVEQARGDGLVRVPWADLCLEAKLGEGASGEIHRARWRAEGNAADESVAVKLFKGAVTSDGLPACEMEACLAAGAHEHLIPVRGRVAEHPAGNEGLLMSLIDPMYRTLAGPPSLESCTRDVYAEDLQLAPAVALSVALGIAAAAQHLHERGILHGDLYAHNVLWNPEGRCFLGDFGAATFFDTGEAAQARGLQGIEVRAFGCLLEELLLHTPWTEEFQNTGNELRHVRDQCLRPEVGSRPGFAVIAGELRRCAGEFAR